MNSDNNSIRISNTDYLDNQFEAKEAQDYRAIVAESEHAVN